MPSSPSAPTAPVAVTVAVSSPAPAFTRMLASPFTAPVALTVNVSLSRPPSRRISSSASASMAPCALTVIWSWPAPPEAARRTSASPVRAPISGTFRVSFPPPRAAPKATSPATAPNRAVMVSSPWPPNTPTRSSAPSAHSGPEVEVGLVVARPQVGEDRLLASQLAGERVVERVVPAEPEEHDAVHAGERLSRRPGRQAATATAVVRIAAVAAIAAVTAVVPARGTRAAAGAVMAATPAVGRVVVGHRELAGAVVGDGDGIGPGRAENDPAAVLEPHRTRVPA